jgi:hypothetical protein
MKRRANNKIESSIGMTFYISYKPLVLDHSTPVHDSLVLACHQERILMNHQAYSINISRSFADCGRIWQSYNDQILKSQRDS